MWLTLAVSGVLGGLFCWLWRWAVSAVRAERSRGGELAARMEMAKGVLEVRCTALERRCTALEERLTRTEEGAALLSRIEDAVRVVVGDLEQTVVGPTKAQTKARLTPEEAGEIRRRALWRVKVLLPPEEEVVRVLSLAPARLEELLLATIETAVGAGKRDRP